MSENVAANLQAAEIERACTDLAASLAFLLGSGAFRIDEIMPADAPQCAVLSASGLRLRLYQDPAAAQGLEPLSIRLHVAPSDLPAAEARVCPGPDRLRLTWVAAPEAITVPKPPRELVLNRAADSDHWGLGRAGMHYRDLIPGRLGGALIASEIRIPEGGPVPDYVHFHRVLFQIIYCKSGWVRVVYQDQGEPFLLNEGDCVLQPPGIRHRVLEAAPGLEVIEFGCPAVHATHAEHEIDLPNAGIDRNRRYQGQRFVRHLAAEAPWRALPGGHFEAQDFGIIEATQGLVGLRALRAMGGAIGGVPPELGLAHRDDIRFLYLLSGSATLISGSQLGAGDALVLGSGDSCVLPAGPDWRLHGEPGLRLLELSVQSVTGV